MCLEYDCYDYYCVFETASRAESVAKILKRSQNEALSAEKVIAEAKIGVLRHLFMLIVAIMCLILCTVVRVINPSLVIQWDNMKSTAASVCEATGKISYRDKIAAMLAMASCRHSSSGARQEQRFYRCPFCHNWHLTKQES